MTLEFIPNICTSECGRIRFEQETPFPNSRAKVFVDGIFKRSGEYEWVYSYYEGLLDGAKAASPSEDIVEQIRRLFQRRKLGKVQTVQLLRAALPAAGLKEAKDKMESWIV